MPRPWRWSSGVVVVALALAGCRDIATQPDVVLAKVADVTASASLDAGPPPPPGLPGVNTCVPGTWFNGIVCFPTPPGTYVDTDGATSPVPCPAGYYQPSPGQTSCIAASPGSYVWQPGQPFSIPCPAGTYQPAAGATTCIPAPIGSYVSQAGAQSATTCPAGTTTRATQSTSLSDCVSLFIFGGFLAPVEMGVLNTVNAGRAIPIKFSLGGDQGLQILMAGSPSSQAIACDSGTPAGASEQARTAGASGLSYDASSDTYTYVWKTSKSWSGTCRRLILELSDGGTYTADFKFSR